MTSYRFFKMAAYSRKCKWKTEIYSLAKFRWDISNHGWDKTTSGLGKRTAVVGMSFYICLPNFVVIGRSGRSYDVMSIFKDGGRRVRNVLPGSGLVPKFDVISQSTAEIKVLPVSENGRPPFWNSISGLEFDVCIVIGMSFCTCLPNYVEIRRS